MPDFEPLPFPELHTSSPALNRAYRVALGDLLGNVRPFQDGLLPQPQPVLLAGLDYDTPWTRDASINVWNGLGLVWPAVARDTLLAVLDVDAAEPQIGGQYWDAIIWTIGAWEYYLQSGDRDFLALAYAAVLNSLARFEREEFDERWSLFRGPAVYGDGVAAYPDRYSPGGTSSILDWVKANPEKKAERGFGIPMMTLSTNCVYYQAYRLAGRMARELGLASDAHYGDRALALAGSIQKHFWNPAKETFHYLVDADGVCDHQEGLGHAFVVLFDLATPEQVQSLLQNQHSTPAGIPCVWPTFPRYSVFGGYGRHSGTVWPFISGFWGEAALQGGRPELFVREFEIFTTHINRDAQCAEIYHPETGGVYGGLQEAGRGTHGLNWTSCARQSWSATAYLRLLLNGLFGLRLSVKGINFQPYLPAGLEHVHIQGLTYRACSIDLTIEGRGGRVVEFRRNGTIGEAFLPADVSGGQHLHLKVAE